MAIKPEEILKVKTPEELERLLEDADLPKFMSDNLRELLTAYKEKRPVSIKQMFGLDMELISAISKLFAGWQPQKTTSEVMMHCITLAAFCIIKEDDPMEALKRAQEALGMIVKTKVLKEAEPAGNA